MIQRITTPKSLLILISFFNGLVFYAPVALLVRTQSGITISQFFILQMILSVSILIFEVPAGYISDKLGYKRSIVCAQGLLLVARLLLLFSKTFWLFGFEAVIEGLSSSLISGTDSAYIYSYYQGEEYTVFCSKMGRAGTIGFILSTITYSLILQLSNISGLVAATFITTFFATFAALFLPKEKKAEANDGHVAIGIMQKQLPKSSFLFFAILSTISVAYLVVNFFYAVKVERIGMDYEHMTFVILGYSIVELLAPVIIKHIKAENYQRAITLALALSAVGFGCIFVIDNLWIIIVMLVMPLMLSVMAYLSDELINENIDKTGLCEKRATVLSIFNMGNNILEIIFLMVSAMLTENEGNIAFLFVGIFLGIVFMGASISYVLHPERDRIRSRN